MQTSFLKEIAIIAIEIAIKNNEDMVLKLDECVNVLDSFNMKEDISSLSNQI